MARSPHILREEIHVCLLPVVPLLTAIFNVYGTVP